MDIKDIIIELQNRNTRHFREFYDLTKKQVFSSAIAILGHIPEVEDVVQDTYLKFVHSCASFDPNRNVYAYLSTIARNEAINFYNKQKRIVRSDEYVNSVADEATNFTDDIELEETLNLLDTNDEKEVVRYHIVLQYKFKDIAEIMEKPLGTVLWIYNKAIKKLRERMKGYE